MIVTKLPSLSKHYKVKCVKLDEEGDKINFSKVFLVFM